MLAGLSGHEIAVAIEASGCTAWAVDLIRGMGVDLAAANPYDVSLISQDRNKTDRRDARNLAKWRRRGPLYWWYREHEAKLGSRKATVALAHKMLKIVHSCDLTRHITRIGRHYVEGVLTLRVRLHRALAYRSGQRRG
jgi:hypothetical protein